MEPVFNKSWPYGYETSFTMLTGVYQRLESGDQHTVALSSGRLFVTGLGRSGRLGVPNTPPWDDLEYFTVSGFTCFLSSDIFTRIKCGYASTYALSANGKWLACGNNFYRQLGFETQFGIGAKTFIKMPEGFNKWPFLEAGMYHTVALSGETIFSIGYLQFGATGHPLSAGILYGSVPALSSWTPIPGKWKAIATLTPASNHIMALSSNNKWFGCGDNTKGCLGFGTQDLGPVYGMKPIPGEWKKIICGKNCTFALSGNNKWFACGDNTSYKLGLLDPLNYYNWTPVPGNWSNIVCGDSHTFAQSSNGVWFGVGNNYQGQLGLSTVPVPTNLWTISSFTVVLNGINYINKVVTGGTGTSFVMIREDTYQPPITGTDLLTFLGTNITTFSGINIPVIT